MDNKEFGKQLEKRTKKFAIEIIKISTLITSFPSPSPNDAG